MHRADGRMVVAIQRFEFANEPRQRILRLSKVTGLEIQTRKLGVRLELVGMQRVQPIGLRQGVDERPFGGRVVAPFTFLPGSRHRGFPAGTIHAGDGEDGHEPGNQKTTHGQARNGK